MGVKKGIHNQTDFNSLLENDPTLASLSEVYYEFRKFVEDPNLGFAELDRIILKDVNLTARILKIVNSAFYSFSSKIETVSRAASVIGTEQLSYILLSTVVMDKFQGIPENVINMDSFWRHSIACGLISKKLAVYKGELNSEKHFTIGMLHDIGRLVMCVNMPNRTWEILIRSNLDNQALHLTEKQELGFDHAQLGGALLKKWNLPEVYQEVAEYHHNPDQALHFPGEVAHCHLADIIANTLKLGCSGESFFVPKLEARAWAKARPPQNISLTVIKDEIEEIFEETAQAFLAH